MKFVDLTMQYYEMLLMNMAYLLIVLFPVVIAVTLIAIVNKVKTGSFTNEVNRNQERSDS